MKYDPEYNRKQLEKTEDQIYLDWFEREREKKEVQDKPKEPDNWELSPHDRQMFAANNWSGLVAKNDALFYKEVE